MQLGRINIAGIEMIFLAVGALLTAAGIYLISFFKKHKEYIPENAFFKAYEESRKSTSGLNEISRKHK